MIIIFGPAGAGKSVQGQIVAARHGWRWLSMGQLLRDTHDPELLKQMSTGVLLDDKITNKVMHTALHNAKDIQHLIIDGYPRHLPQAEWLVDALPRHNRDIALVLVLEVPQAEVLHRLTLRGRVDDTPESIAERLHIYHREVQPIITYFNKQQIRVAHIDGMGTVGQVHDRIEAALQSCSLV